MAQARRARWHRLYPPLWWFTVVVLLFLAIYVVVGRQLMLLVPDYRERLELMFEERIQTPLTIAELDGKMSGLVPQFVARKIRLPAPEGEAPLELEEVVLGVDMFRSLLHRDLVLQSLRIRGVELELVRGEDGKIRLRGLDSFGGGDNRRPPIERILRFFYRQQMLTLRDVHLSLDWPGMPPLAASELDATLINDGSEHRLAINLEARDRPLSVQARLHLHDSAYSLEQLNANLYAKVRGERLHEWLPQPRDWPVDVAALDGGVEMWAELRAGQPYQGLLNLQLPVLTLQSEQQSWPLSRLALVLALQRDKDSATLSIPRLSGQSPAGPVSLADLALNWDTQGEQRSWRVQAEGVPVHALSQQFQQWPLPVPQALVKAQAQWKKLAPRGVLEGVYVSGRARQLETFQARFTGLASQADDRIPGVQGLTGWVAGNAEQGVVHLYSDNLSLNLPRLYDHPLTGQLSGVLDWQKQGDSITVRSSRLRVLNPDAYGELMLALQLQPQQMPLLRLKAEIYDGNGARASHYVPFRRLSQGLGDWLGQAIVDGHLRRGQILYNGPVKIDRERQQDRTLQMRYQGDNVTLSFLPGWPEISGASADVFINGRQVQARGRHGRLLGSELQQVFVDVPAFADGETPRVIVNGQARGRLEDLDALFQQTPLREQLPAEVLDWRYRGGQMQGHVLLDMPLQSGVVSPTVIVDAAVSGGRIENLARNLTLSEVRAPVYFHLQEGMQISRLYAKTLGGEFNGQWHTREGHSRLQLDGHLPMEQARDWLGFSWLAPLSGELPLGLTVEVPWQGNPFSLRAASSLHGISVDAPAPLGKGAEESRPLELRLQPSGDHLAVDVDYAGLLRGSLQVGDSISGDLLLGSGGGLRLPPEGINIRGNVASASAMPWIDFIGNTLVPSLEGGQGGAAPVPSKTALNKVDLDIDMLDLFGVPVSAASLSVLPAPRGWDLALSSPQVAGSMHIPAGFAARGDTPLELMVTRTNLRLPTTGNDDSGAPLSPLDLPAMNVSLDNIRVDGEDFGQWRAQVRPVGDGVRISELQGRWRHTRFNGAMDWTDQDGQQYSRYNGSLASANLGATLKAWELPALIEADEAVAKVTLGWANWPLDPDYLALDGQARVDIGECQIPDTDSKTSFLRLLGILNLGTIQRRLRLDFSDLYKKGLSCDRINGDFMIDGPQVSTANLAIDSPSAAIRVNGTIDLDKETLNHKMEVTLPLSSNLYAGCLAGPAACAGIFVVERIWGDKLDKTATMEYQVTGNWSNPKVKESEGMFE